MRIPWYIGKRSIFIYRTAHELEHLRRSKPTLSKAFRLHRRHHLHEARSHSYPHHRFPRTRSSHMPCTKEGENCTIFLSLYMCALSGIDHIRRYICQRTASKNKTWCMMEGNRGNYRAKSTNHCNDQLRRPHLEGRPTWAPRCPTYTPHVKHSS
jgi:Zn-finger protein